MAQVGLSHTSRASSKSSLNHSWLAIWAAQCRQWEEVLGEGEIFGSSSWRKLHGDGDWRLSGCVMELSHWCSLTPANLVLFPSPTNLQLQLYLSPPAGGFLLIKPWMSESAASLMVLYERRGAALTHAVTSLWRANNVRLIACFVMDPSNSWLP